MLNSGFASAYHIFVKKKRKIIVFLAVRGALCYNTVQMSNCKGRGEAMARPNSKWYRLDNAGILYSALQKEEYSAIYRFSALMEKDVDPAALQRAIDRCMPRFHT